MKSLLVLAQHPELANEVRAAVDPAEYRVLSRSTVEEAEPLLQGGLADACLVDADLTGVPAIWLVEKIQRWSPRCPILLVTAARQGEWEEEAILRGVRYIINKPLRPRMVSALLARLWTESRPAALRPQAAGGATPLAAAREPAPEAAATGHTTTFGRSTTLAVLRDVSAILSHSLCGEAMLTAVLSHLREILGVNRAAVFLRPPAAVVGEGTERDEHRRLRAACGLGLPQGLLEHLELSLDAGIGRYVYDTGRILRLQSEAARGDIEIQKEFELLRAQVAVPILDRETLVGLAVFDARLTGEPLSGSELELIFHLLERVGLALKNIWLHDQLAANNELMAGILHELSSACVVVGQDLTVLHANKLARRYFPPAPERGELEFADLPQFLGAKIHQVLRTGAAVEPFRYTPEGTRGQVFQVSVVPFRRQGTALPDSALLIMEDLTVQEQLKHLEVETSRLKLIKAMSDRVAHEIGNALTPLSTLQQMIQETRKRVEQLRQAESDKKKPTDGWLEAERNLAQHRVAHETAAIECVRRINRLVNQMRLLARDSLVSQSEMVPAELLERAFHEARAQGTTEAVQLQVENQAEACHVRGDREALEHALSEILLNALQANPAEARIHVRVAQTSDVPARLRIEVRDSGPGFTTETAAKATEPFFTQRNVGLGLGLTVARKVFELHGGRLEIVPDSNGGLVRVALPVAELAEPPGESRARDHLANRKLTRS